MPSPATTLTVPACPEGRWPEREVKVSSPDRVIFPGSGVTKLGLAQYFCEVGPWMVGHLAGRPLTLERWGKGVAEDGSGDWFYTKNPPKGMPEWVPTVMCTYPSGRQHTQLVANEPATLVWAAQMNTITVHPWPMREPMLDNPDELRIDLDPHGNRSFGDVVAAALLLREVMADAGLTAWVKTSGKRGLHITAPIEPTHEILDVRHAAIALGREMVRRVGELVTVEWWKELRGDRVFVDYNQMARDRTLAAALSPRAVPEGAVSFPVSWDELGQVVPQDFTVLSVPGLLHDKGDAWAVLHSNPGSVETALEWWERDVAAGFGEMPFPPDYPKMPGEPPRVQPSRAKKT